MKRIAILISLAALLLPARLAVAAQNGGTAPNQGAGNVASSAPVLRILAPAAGARLAQPFVAVRFELTNPGVSPSPSFRLQLDERDPVTTASTEYTFNSVTPGTHVLIVDLVDANNTPVAGSRSQVKFTTLAPGASPMGAMLARLQRPDPRLVRAALDQPQLRVQPPPPPTASGALPLLSVIGFGVLLGGIASAMKTR